MKTIMQYLVAACWIGAVVAVFGTFFAWIGNALLTCFTKKEVK